MGRVFRVIGVHHGHGGEQTPRLAAEGIIRKLLDKKSSFVESTKKLHDFVERQKDMMQKGVDKGKGMEDREERWRKMTGLGNFRVEDEEERGSEDESEDERPTASGVTKEEQPTRQPSDVDENENQDTPTISQPNTQKKKGGRPLGRDDPTYRPGPDDESSTSEQLSDVVIEEDDILEPTATTFRPPTTTPPKKKPGWKKRNGPTFRPQKGDWRLMGVKSMVLMLGRTKGRTLGRQRLKAPRRALGK